MLNIINEINTYVLTKTTPYSVIYNNAFQNDSSTEICCRSDPSSANVVTYLDGSQIGEQNFAYYAKHTDQAIAKAQLETILGILNFAEMQQITDGIFIKIEAITRPVFVSMSDNKEFIFTASLRCEYATTRGT